MIGWLLLCGGALPWLLWCVYVLRQRRKGGQVLQLALYRAQRRNRRQSRL